MGKSLEYGYGLLEYDDVSDHIIVKYPLTSNDVAGHGGATVVGTGASTFDSLRGYKPYYTDGVSNAPANGYLGWDAASNPVIPADQVYRILGGYTIAFEVETSVLLALPHSVVFTAIDPVGASEQIRALVTATGVIEVSNNTRNMVDTTGIKYRLAVDRYSEDDFLDNEFTTIRYSVSTGSKLDIFWGKKWMCSAQFAAGLLSDANPLRLVTMGGFANGETFPGYVRKMFVVDRPVLLPTDKSIGRIAFLGDSLTNQANTLNSDNYPFSANRYGADVGGISNGDYTIPNEVHRRFSELDRYVEPYVFALTGAYISDIGANRFINQINGVNTANARDFRPQAIVIPGGTNDVRLGATMTDAGGVTFGAGYRELLDEILSWGYVKLIVLANIPSLSNDPAEDTPEIAAKTIAGNAIIDALLAEYAAANPTVTFVLANRYTAFGGAVANADLFVSDNIHFNTDGDFVHAKTLYDAIISSGL